MKDGISRVDLELVRGLCSQLLEMGLTTREYMELVDELGELLDKQRSYRIIDWTLDVASMLSTDAVLDAESCTRFFAKVGRLGEENSHRLTELQRRSLRLLYLDFAIPEIPPYLVQVVDDDQIDDIGLVLDKKKIGIYTLTEQAGLRARELLKELSGSVSVTVNHDLVCTERLKNLAQSVDIFVFAWKSSSHQAFYCVKENRRDKSSLLQPRGKGSTSIVSEVVEYVSHG